MIIKIFNEELTENEKLYGYDKGYYILTNANENDYQYLRKEFCRFINNNVGEIIECTNRYVSVRYDNVPDDIKIHFIAVITENENYYRTYIILSDIEHCFKKKIDAEKFAKYKEITNKFNL